MKIAKLTRSIAGKGRTSKCGHKQVVSGKRIRWTATQKTHKGGC